MEEAIMRRLKYLSIIFTFNLSAWATSHDTMHFVQLKAKNVHERSQIAQHIHIDQIIEQDVYATVNDFDLSALKTFHADKIVQSHPLYSPQKIDLRFADEYDFPAKDSAYHTYDELLTAIDDLVSRFSSILEVYTLGLTVEGREIPLIRITHAKNRNAEFFTPGILFVGSHHAREHLSTEIPLMLAQHLVKNYHSDAKIKNLVDNRDIYIVPLLNVDGKLYDIKGRKYKYWRKNRRLNTPKKEEVSLNHGPSYRWGSSKGSSTKPKWGVGKPKWGVDLNRNYSYRWGTGGSSTRPGSNVYMGPAPFSEPETVAMKNFIESNPHIRVLLSYHTYSELILYPWSSTHSSVGGKDQQIFQQMAKDMAQWNDYTPQQSSDLYIASGETCDWAYGEHNIYCFTFELSPRNMWSGGFYPGSKIIQHTFDVNLGPALYLIEYSDDPSRTLQAW